MKPVTQTKLHAADGIHSGNCYAAALASLLELPLWMVPPFEDMFGRPSGGLWYTRTDEWLHRMFGLEIVTMPGHNVDHLPEFYIANGPSPRGVMHSTIYSGGRMVHDPHPSGAGISEVKSTYHLVKAGAP